MSLGRRFASYGVPDPGRVRGLPPSHPALREARTLFPKSVVNPQDSPRLLIEGHNQRKVGARMLKGPWKGMPLYTLTLEERATCPSSCAQWSTCYGNAMHWSRRHRHGPELERLLRDEVAILASAHPKGFAVRLHILGDFYSDDYVTMWCALLALHPELHIFGFTAHARDSMIGASIMDTNRAFPGRCGIRFSQAAPAPMAAIVVEKPEEKPAGAVICPAQTEATDGCGTCGLCWAPAFAGRTIAFLRHGAQFGLRKARMTHNPGLVYPGTGKVLKRERERVAAIQTDIPQRRAPAMEPEEVRYGIIITALENGVPPYEIINFARDAASFVLGEVTLNTEVLRPAEPAAASVEAVESRPAIRKPLFARAEPVPAAGERDEAEAAEKPGKETAPPAPVSAEVVTAAKAKPETLSERELQVVDLFKSGKDSHAIARELRLGEATVMAYLYKARRMGKIPADAKVYKAASAPALPASEIRNEPPPVQARTWPREIKCMRCPREFTSEGPHNRLCSFCRHDDAGPQPASVHV